MGCEGIDRGREYKRARTMFITRVPQVSRRMVLFNKSLFWGHLPICAWQDVLDKRFHNNGLMYLLFLLVCKYS